MVCVLWWGVVGCVVVYQFQLDTHHLMAQHMASQAAPDCLMGLRIPPSRGHVCTAPCAPP